MNTPNSNSVNRFASSSSRFLTGFATCYFVMLKHKLLSHIMINHLKGLRGFISILVFCNDPEKTPQNIYRYTPEG